MTNTLTPPYPSDQHNNASAIPVRIVGSSTSSASTVTPITTSGTINTFTVLVVANSARNGGFYQNTGTGTQYIFIGAGTAAESSSIKVPAGTLFSLANGNIILRDELQIASTVVSDTGVLVTQ